MFQISGVKIPGKENTTAIYAARLVESAPHRSAALAYLQTDGAQAAYAEFGFKPRVDAVEQ